MWGELCLMPLWTRVAGVAVGLLLLLWAWRTR